MRGLESSWRPFFCQRWNTMEHTYGALSDLFLFSGLSARSSFQAARLWLSWSVFRGIRRHGWIGSRPSAVADLSMSMWDHVGSLE